MRIVHIPCTVEKDKRNSPLFLPFFPFSLHPPSFSLLPLVGHVALQPFGRGKRTLERARECKRKTETRKKTQEGKRKETEGNGAREDEQRAEPHQEDGNVNGNAGVKRGQERIFDVRGSVRCEKKKQINATRVEENNPAGAKAAKRERGEVEKRRKEGHTKGRGGK